MVSLSLSQQSQPTLTSKPAIEVTGVQKRFGEWRSLLDLARRQPRAWLTVLTDVSFTVQSGEVFGVLGTNGAGKTTLTKILCTMILPDQGTVRVAGHDVVTEPLRVRQQVGYVTCADRSFEERISARANLEFFGSLSGLQGKECRYRVDEVLEQVGLTEAARQAVRGYSTGMKQKLAIARALLHHPSILFLDEPTSGLDPMAAAYFRQFLRQLAQDQQRTIFLCTHTPDEIEQLCDRVLFLHRGQSLASGTLRELRHQVQGTRQYELRLLPSHGDTARWQSHLQARLASLLTQGWQASSPTAMTVQGETFWQLTLRLPVTQSLADLGAVVQGLSGSEDWWLVGCQEVQMPLADLYSALTTPQSLNSSQA